MKVHKTISRSVVCLALLAMLFSTSLVMVGARAGDNKERPGSFDPLLQRLCLMRRKGRQNSPNVGHESHKPLVPRLC